MKKATRKQISEARELLKQADQILEECKAREQEAHERYTKAGDEGRATEAQSVVRLIDETQKYIAFANFHSDVLMT